MISSSWAGLLLPFLPSISAFHNYTSSPNSSVPLPTFPGGQLPPITSWPSNLTGVPYATQLPDDELTSILQQVDPLRIKAIVETLVSFGTRHTQSSQTDPERGIGAARDWILKEYEGYARGSGGWMTVELQSYIQGAAGRISAPTNISNIIATLKGSSEPERIVVMSGHYDSRNTNVSNFIDDAPGADDDASGVAIAMELARIMSTHRPVATIQFAAVAGEEQGLLGATYMAQTLANRSANVQGMYTNDIVGSPIGDDGKNQSNIIRIFAQGVPTNETKSRAAQRLSIGGENDSPARQLARFTVDVGSNNATGLQVETVYRADRYLRGGDHSSFLAAGYAANRFTEPREDFAHQHQDVRVENSTQYGDLPEFCDWYYIARVGRVTGAAAWSLAQGPDGPRGVSVDTAGLTNDSMLKWKRVNGAIGYEVLWRGTDESSWRGVIDVGDVESVVVEISKDNVVFGVRSVGENGFKSPAVFPFPG
ncbi:related to Probable zinc metalloprotease Lema_P086240 [Rhynchosporium agropyri]|uniref:Peptide hydrolase n=1 Tax=Rhynchosporium agropyri TaxID=914238 RepID=A0A1E1KCK2_9HELO|nr:related to Probable zinc metalloprotease Lema_P086240 [Rhynchosporium agropyri]